MEYRAILEAEAEAERFLMRVADLRDRYSPADLHHIQGCKETGAVRRASLDLTKALAQMRRP